MPLKKKVGSGCFFICANAKLCKSLPTPFVLIHFEFASSIILGYKTWRLTEYLQLLISHNIYSTQMQVVSSMHRNKYFEDKNDLPAGRNHLGAEN